MRADPARHRGRYIALIVTVVAGVAAAGAATAAPEYIPNRWIGVPVATLGAVVAFAIGLVWDRRSEQRRIALQRAEEWAQLLGAGPSTAPSAGRAAGESMLVLLAPESQVVPFVRNRYHELAPLRRWCENPAEERIWLLQGGPGCGKTRLAISLTEMLRSKPDSDWTCGWLGTRGVDGVALAAELDGPVLIVVDDADTRPDLVEVLDAVENRGTSNTLRVLLIARDFSEWWTLVRKTSRASLATEGRTTELGALADDVATQRVLVRRAVASFADRLQVDMPQVEVLGVGEGTPPLLLHAAALDAVYRRREGGSGPADVDHVVERVLRRESKLWWRSAENDGLTDYPGITAESLRDILVLAMLIGGRDEKAGVKLLRTLPELGNAPADLVDKVIVWLRMYGRVVGYAMRPHLPALYMEHLAADAMARSESLTRAVATAANSPTKVRHVLGVLTRASTHTDAAHAAIGALVRLDRGRMLDQAIRLAAAGMGPIDNAIADAVDHCRLSADTAIALYDMVPDRTMRLEATGIALARKCAALTKGRPRVRFLTDLTDRLFRSAQFARAAEAGASAVEAARSLSRSGPGSRAELGYSLIARARALTRQSGPVKAQRLAEEAVSLAAGNSSDGADPELFASATGMLSEALHYQHRPSLALAESQTALDAVEQLYAIDHHKYLVVYADRLVRHMICLRLSDLWEQSAIIGKEAVQTFEKLANLFPDAHVQNLAWARNNYADTLSRLSRHEESLDLCIGTLRLIRESSLPRTLILHIRATEAMRQQVDTLSSSGRIGESVIAAEEVVSRLRTYYSMDPELSMYLADDLRNFGKVLTLAGRLDEARVRLEEAMTLRRDLLKRQPYLRVQLGYDLMALARTLLKGGLRSEALSAATEARGIFQEGPLQDADPSIYAWVTDATALIRAAEA